MDDALSLDQHERAEVRLPPLPMLRDGDTVAPFPIDGNGKQVQTGDPFRVTDEPVRFAGLERDPKTVLGDVAWKPERTANVLRVHQDDGEHSTGAA